jgi:anaerobic magnesium-protoporphyrin IX monomethyl ester cyclase
MPREEIAFVAYLDQDNLGVGYIASLLLEKGFAITLIDMRKPAAEILQEIQRAKPLIIGFSIVFQYHLDEFRELMSYLRRGGVGCHFCAGGHYPSFRYRELLEVAPELDSVVLFEGELTFSDMAEAVRDGLDWRRTTGLAYRDNGAVMCSGLRPLENDLDRFPLPVRKPTRAQLLNRNVVNILAGRGCHYDCSFCSIRSFYREARGKARRIRRPEYVAREMQLHREADGSCIFLFQDDDFPLAGAEGKAWTQAFCRALRDAGLQERVLWKVSCRPNEVDEASLSLMMAHGLGMVYLGIESGSRSGLELMRKGISPDTSLAAVRTLKMLGLAYEFGFMVFDPSSTFDSVRENLKFLETVCGDGSAAVSLGRMLPLAGTQIERQLREQKRLSGPPAYEDYEFLDPLLNEYFRLLSDAFRPWMHGDEGVMTLSRWVHLQSIALRRFCHLGADTAQAFEETQSAANRFLIRACESLADTFQSSTEARRNEAAAALSIEVSTKHAEFAARLHALADRMSVQATWGSDDPSLPDREVIPATFPPDGRHVRMARSGKAL